MPRNNMFVREVKSVGFVDYGACGGDVGQGGADIVLFKRGGLVRKDAMSFDDVQQQEANRRAMSELWSTLNQFDDSVRSIVNGDGENKQAAIDESLAEFVAFLEVAVPQWAQGETVNKGAKMAKKDDDKTVDLEKLDAKGLLDAAKSLAAKVATATAEKAKGDDAVATLTAEVEKLKADAEKSAKKAEPTDDDVLKNADPAIIALIEKGRKDTEAATKRADEAISIAKAETEKRESAEWVEKAKAFDALPGTHEEIGAALRKANSALDDGEFEMLAKMLKAGNSAIAKGFDEIGSGRGGGEGGAWAEIEKQAAEIVKSAGVTVHKARTQVMEQNPDLVEAYRKEA